MGKKVATRKHIAMTVQTQLVEQEKKLLNKTQYIGSRELTVEEKRALLGMQMAVDKTIKNPQV